jgi:hypothetical protein
MRLGAAAAAALLSSAVVRSAAAQRECPDSSELAEAESEQMQTDLVQTRAQIFESPSRAPGAAYFDWWRRRYSTGGGGSSVHTASLLRSSAGAVLSAEQRASLLLPVAWFHVSKTGTSICNTLYHTPGICPLFSADNYIDDAESGSWDKSWGNKDELCPGGFSTSYRAMNTKNNNTRLKGNLVNGPDPVDFSTQPYNHMGIGGLKGRFYIMNRGRFVTMLRQPEQRLISMYYHYGPQKMYDQSDNLQIRVWPYSSMKHSSVSLREYAEFNGGCTVKQLTWDVLDPCQSFPLPRPKSDDVSLAITVLQEGFAFVGITEQWALSVCLFRVMFGGQCLASDFLDIRPGSFSNASESESGYDTSELQGWTDVWDRPVYDEALSMFASTRKVYGVDDSSCAALCDFSGS